MNKSIYFSLAFCINIISTNSSLASEYRNQDEVAYINSEDEQMLRQYMEFENNATKNKPTFVQLPTVENQYVIDVNNASSFSANNLPDSPRVIRKYYQNNIQNCMDTYKEELDIARGVLTTSNFYSATADLTNIFANINQCYENIGYQIIGHLYNGSKEEYSNFAKKAQTYYIKASNTNFKPIYCEENCSLEALVSAQIQKFADFRVYLTKLVETKISGK